MGAATLAPVAAAVKSYSSLEDAMKGVAKQVNGLRDDSGNRTPQYEEMQRAIMDASEKLPMANGAVDYAALVEGGARMGVANSDDPWQKQKADLLSFASMAAKASVAFELPADQLSESLGKIAGLYKIPTQNIEQLGDAINYLDDNAKSKGSDIIDVLQRVGGLASQLDYKQAAALGSTAAERQGRDILMRIGVSGFAMMNIMILSVAVWSGADAATRDMFHWISGAIALPTVVFAGQPFFSSAWRAISHGRLGMDVPISLALILASAISVYETVNSGRHAYFDAAVMLPWRSTDRMHSPYRMFTATCMGFPHNICLMKGIIINALVLIPQSVYHEKNRLTRWS